MDASEATGIDRRASVTVDREGIIRQWGEAVTEVVGYSAEDALGQSLNVVIPPALRPVHWWGFDQAMKSGRLNKELFKVPALCIRLQPNERAQIAKRRSSEHRSQSE